MMAGWYRMAAQEFEREEERERERGNARGRVRVYPRHSHDFQYTMLGRLGTRIATVYRIKATASLCPWHNGKRTRAKTSPSQFMVRLIS